MFKRLSDEYKKNIEIKNLKNIDLKNGEFVFHAGTKNEKSKIFSNGGRVLNFVILSENSKK